MDIKVGLIGTGGIARVALAEIAKIDGAEVTAAWARTLEHGVRLAQEWGIGYVTDDIDEFLASDLFDTVYIGLPNHVHHRFMKAALEHGKHVICEKPFTPTAAEAHELATIARERGLFLFDGSANHFYANYHELRRRITEIGQPRMAHLNMSQISSKYAALKQGKAFPVLDPACAGGALYDLNGINALLVIGMFGKPESVAYYPNKASNGIDTSGLLVMRYDGFLAECFAAKDSASQDYLIIQGEEGYFSMIGNPAVIEGIDLVKNGCEPERIDIEHVEDQRENLFRTVFGVMDRGDCAWCYRELDDTVRLMEVLEEARRFAGIEFTCGE